MITTRFYNRSYRCNYVKVNNTRCHILIYHTPITIRKTYLIEFFSRCDIRKLQSPNKLGKSLKGLSKYEAIRDVKMTHEILLGVPPVLKMCTYSLPEDDNWNFAMGSPSDLYFTLGPTQLSSSPNKSVNFLSLSDDFHWMRGVN